MDYANILSLTSKMTQSTKDTFATKQQVDYNDQRFWKLSVDENDMGEAIIRFLPAPESMIKSVESLPPFYTNYFEHSWSYTVNGKRKYVYVKCKGRKKISNCPICTKSSVLDENGQNLWQRNSDEWKKRSAKEKFITNILVVKDPKHPENNGKNFLFIFGKEIKAIIDKAIEGESSLVETIEGKDVINFENGYDFHLKTAKESGQAIRTYNNSKFLSAPSKIGYYNDKDEKITFSEKEIMDLWAAEYNIEDIVMNQSKAFPNFYTDDEKTISALNYYLNVTGQGDSSTVPQQQPVQQQTSVIENIVEKTEPNKSVENIVEKTEPSKSVENFIQDVTNSSTEEKIDIDGIDLSGLDLDDDDISF